jgi:hypothetical protein
MMTDFEIELLKRASEENIGYRSDLAVGELLSTVREASVYDDKLIDVTIIENALIALALLNGAENVPSLDAAVKFFQSLAKVKDGNESVIKSLEEEIGIADVSLQESNERVDSLEGLLSDRGEARHGITISPPLALEMAAALRESSIALDSVPGRRELSQRAHRASRAIGAVGIRFFVPIDEHRLRQAFNETT